MLWEHGYGLMRQLQEVEPSTLLVSDLDHDAVIENFDDGPDGPG
jgi:hypothetical protein